VDSQRVIRSYLVISALFTVSASLIWGINTLFLLDAGLTIFKVFIANAVFTAAMALFEIPTGVVADTRGRRASFLLSEATLAVGTLAYVGVAAVEGGYLSQERSVPAGFVVGCAATILTLPIFARLRALNEPADRITAEAPESDAPPTPPKHPEGDSVAAGQTE
jgi:MFS family permease